MLAATGNVTFSVMSTLAQRKSRNVSPTNTPTAAGSAQSRQLRRCSVSGAVRKNAIKATSSGYSKTVLNTKGAMMAVNVPPTAPPRAIQK